MPHPVLELIRAREGATGPFGDGAKLALAIEGGGMRGAITGGMALELDTLDLTPVFDEVYGSSAGTLNAAWLLSGAAQTGISTWSDPVLRNASVRRGNFFRGRPLVDSRYLTDVVYERLAPMPFERILESRAGFHPLATDAATGESTDLAPLISDRETLKASLRATMALPILAGQPVAINGRRFFDAGLSESVPFRTAIRQGATHVLVLRSRRDDEQESSNSGRSARLIARYLSRHGAGTAEAFLGRAQRLLSDDEELALLERDPEARPSVISVRPPEGTASISRLERDSGVVADGIAAGQAALRARFGGD
jgi:predicted patatin/cPLA2 family phospholipase